MIIRNWFLWFHTYRRPQLHHRSDRISSWVTIRIRCSSARRPTLLCRPASNHLPNRLAQSALKHLISKHLRHHLNLIKCVSLINISSLVNRYDSRSKMKVESWWMNRALNEFSCFLFCSWHTFRTIRTRCWAWVVVIWEIPNSCRDQDQMSSPRETATTAPPLLVNQTCTYVSLSDQSLITLYANCPHVLTTILVSILFHPHMYYFCLLPV